MAAVGQKMRGGSNLGGPWATLSLPSVVNGNPPDSGILVGGSFRVSPRVNPYYFLLGGNASQSREQADARV